MIHQYKETNHSILSKEIFKKIFPQRDYIIISKTVFVQDNNNIIVPLLGTHKYFSPLKIRLTELFYSQSFCHFSFLKLFLNFMGITILQYNFQSLKLQLTMLLKKDHRLQNSLHLHNSRVSNSHLVGSEVGRKPLTIEDEQPLQSVPRYLRLMRMPFKIPVEP